MQRGNTAALNNREGGHGAYPLRRLTRLPPYATSRVGYRRGRGDLTISPFPYSVALLPTNQPGYHPILGNVQPGLAFVQQGHGVPQITIEPTLYSPPQVRSRTTTPPERARGPNLSALLADRVSEALHELPHPFLSEIEGRSLPYSAVSVQGGPYTLSGFIGNAFPFVPAARPLDTFQSEHLPSVRGPQGAAALRHTRLFVGGSALDENPAPELQVVPYGQVDPGKASKRKDEEEDKQRKQGISKEQGACLRCKRVKKQCNGETVCNRCRRGGHDCIRTCNACWSKRKLSCDEGACCKNCRVAGITCMRPSLSHTGTRDEQSTHIAVVPVQALNPVSSSAPVNRHTMQEREQRLPGTAWNVEFRVGSAGQGTEESTMTMTAWNNAHAGSRPFSQQSTDVGLYQSLSQVSTTNVASDYDRLDVPGKFAPGEDSVSETTETSFYDDAMYYSSLDPPQTKDGARM